MRSEQIGIELKGWETEGLWKKNIGDLKVVGIVGRSSLEASIFQYEFKFTVTWNVLTKLQQVIAKMKSKHMAGTFTKKKKCIVTGVCSDVQAWPGREKED
ncbi:hypothetical protein AHAS_Ahas02G0001400 [Arachis hypogaea]